jgi:myosin-5
METINSTNVHYIRCIKPNEAKKPFYFESVYVLHQLRACGVLETIRISCAGYPSRWSFGEFAERYRLLLPSTERKSRTPQETAVQLLKAVIKDEDKYQVGLSKVFLRAGQVAFIEKLRAETLRNAVVMIQKHVRGFRQRQKYAAMRTATIKIQACVRGKLARNLFKFKKSTRAAIILQKYIRRYLGRQRFLRTKKAAIVFQCGKLHSS